MRQLTKQERKVVDVLGDAWNEFLVAVKEPTMTTSRDDIDDFRKAIHDAQRIVMARPSKLDV